MDLKKRFIIVGLCGFLSISTATAKPFGLPKFDKNVATKMNITPDEYGFNFDDEQLSQKYKKITKEPRVMQAIELMQGTIGEYSRKAILGENITNKKMKIQFKNLGAINPAYANFDALGWQKSKRVYIYINQKHADAPPTALAALLSHEALHQDKFDSLNEETYAWTMEAAVWTQLSEKYPKTAQEPHPLVHRENTLKNLFKKGDYTDKYIKKTVFSNPGYKNLPLRSPGYEDEDL